MTISTTLTRRGIRIAGGLLIAATLGMTGAPSASADFGTPTTVTGSDAADRLFGSNQADKIFMKAGSDSAYARKGNDVMFGDSGSDHFLPGPGGDTAYGGTGDDVFYDDDAERDWLVGGADRDLAFTANGAADFVDCGSGSSDSVIADAEDTVVDCENVITKAGTTTFQGSTVHVFMNGIWGPMVDHDYTGGVFYIFDKLGDYSIVGSQTRRNWISPGDGHDHVLGSPFPDTIVDDDDDSDHLDSGAGNDVVYAGNGTADTIDCGSGDTDMLVADKSDTVVNCEYAAIK